MSLIDDAKAAHAAGLSYGQYMTTKAAPEKKEPKPKKVCANCGDPLVGGRIRFCCNECRAAFREKNRKGDKYV